MASLSQGRTAAAQWGLFTYKSVPVIFEPPCIFKRCASMAQDLVKTPMSDPDEHTHLMSMWQINNMKASVSLVIRPDRPWTAT